MVLKQPVFAGLLDNLQSSIFLKLFGAKWRILKPLLTGYFAVWWERKEEAEFIYNNVIFCKSNL